MFMTVFSHVQSCKKINYLIKQREATGRYIRNNKSGFQKETNTLYNCVSTDGSLLSV